MRGGKSAAALLAVATAVGTSRGVSAHRLDECLQAARIAIEPSHVELELDLTPGVAVVDAIISDVDRDRDGSFSADERQAYADRVLAVIDLQHDGQPLHVTPGAATFAEIDALRRGDGMIRLRADARLPNLSDGVHHVFFRNRYRPDVSVYLANALVPQSERVAVRAQQHEAQQRDLTIDYTVRSRPSPTRAAWPLAGLTGCLAVLLIRRRI